MMRAIVLLCFVSLALATPPVSRSKEDVEAFREFLESTKIDDDGKLFKIRTEMNPMANAEEVSGKFEGDIVLDDVVIESMLKEYATGRNGYTWPGTKWPNNEVVYEFGEGHFGPIQQEAILEGIRDIEEHTCIRFRERRAGETNFVRLTGDPSGCFAHVGYWETRGVHTLNLARNVPGVACFRHGTIVHEWLHILGFFHMQSTHDRDNYVRIVTENINPGSLNNFNIYTPDLVSNHEVSYDYVSCLHYGPFAFTINGQATIIALQEHEGTMGQREYITDKDWLRVNRHYDCPGAWD